MKCSHHSSQKGPEADINENDLDCLKTVLGPVLQLAMKSFYKYSQTRNETKTEDCVLILYNDENHSFDDVIDTLTTEIEDCEESAEFYAGLVDVKVKTIFG